MSGGFSLARDIEYITLLEIIDIFEGADICKNLEGDSRLSSEGFYGCFNEINEHFRAELSKYTVRDLLPQAKSQAKAGRPSLAWRMPQGSNTP